jgi:starvation-inducible DNA-binding protein
MAQAASVLKPKVKDEEFDIGLKKAYRQQMAAALSDILADTYKLVIKSHIYHWNVVGPLFKPLHELTEEHYNTLFKATDIIAERIRALGHLAPAKLGEANQFAPTSASVNHTTAAEMVADLIPRGCGPTHARRRHQGRRQRRPGDDGHADRPAQFP